MRPLTDLALLEELEPTVAANLDRHLTMAQEWMPHEWVPWSRGRNFAGDDGLAWSPDQSRLSEPARAAFVVNLLTEDNLPSYHHELMVRYGRDGAWKAWVHRWTAEESRHAMSIRDYLLLSRAVDPAALERERMATMEAGWSAEGRDMLRALVYVALQELATRVAHQNTGKVANDPVADQLLTRIALDENLHMIFYRDLVTAALTLAPDQTLIAVASEAMGFKMPGTGVPGFLRRSVQIADAGIYDVRLHRDEVLAPLVRHWQVLTLPVSTDTAKQAQTTLAGHLERLEQMAKRQDERRSARLRE
jgi:acyl-[acyl-carrier-protein] desaturase